MKYLLEKTLSKAIDFVDKYYHMKDLSKYLKQFNFKDDSIIFDVGAHKGEYLDFFLRLNKNFKIFSFEPQKKIFESLKVKYNNQNNVYLNNLGLGEKKENLEMKINIKSSTSTFSKLNYSSNYLKFKSKILGNKMFYKSEISPIQTIDNYMFENNLNKVDILKIDTMGFEYKVLSGAEKTLSKIKLILIEFRSHDLYIDYDSKQIHDFLIKNNFLLQKSFKFPFMNWEDRAYINESFKQNLKTGNY